MHEDAQLGAFGSRSQAVVTRPGLLGYLVINAFFGASSGDQSLNEVFRKNSEPVIRPAVCLE